jgi:DNA-binding NtrC family response regulator
MLRGTPNAWLEAIAEHLQVAIAIMRSDFHRALHHAIHAADLAERSGAANSYAASQGNLSNVLLLLGDYDRAIHHQQRSLEALPAASENYIAAYDTLARIKLAQNGAGTEASLLNEIDRLLSFSDSRPRYVYRHALLTRAHTLSRCGRFDEALDQVEVTVQLAETSGDVLLLHLAVLTKAELLAITSRAAESLETMERVVLSVIRQPPEVYALYERVLACALSSENNWNQARAHFQRAARLYSSLSHAPGLVELRWLRKLTVSSPAEAGPSDGHDVQPDDPSSSADMFQGLATLMVYAGRPELIARELVALLWATGALLSAKAVARGADRVEATLVCVEDAAEKKGVARRLAIGLSSAGEIEVVVALKPGAESAAVFNAARFLVESLREVEQARADREERATLWPIEELPVTGERSVISGQLRELMTLARRIAKTNVTVLITGESGTGKEILARAIHDFSDRAQKPFVPFNCTAIPRDLLESQLFGHRRGAFTGADRDQIGLIRTARGGTLFLDEVGELGLDLQPKLLRFLESGEISPLGEPTSLTIDVRIVAATNANLEEAVHAGKFREDLFYRLDVVRLSIRPLRERRDEIPGFVNHFLARAAEEFGKGQLRVADETMERLLLYRWPGNVRQLQNEVRRMAALAEPNSTLVPDDISGAILAALPLHHTPLSSSEIAVSLHDKLLPTLARIESEMIKAALTRHGGKVEAVAKALGISRKGLYLKRQRLGL